MKKLLRRLMTGLSFTSVMFIFQACYGTPQDMESDLFIEGYVKSKLTNEPIPGIKVSVNDYQYEYTNTQGYFSMYTSLAENYTIHFQDVDSARNGQFLAKDTIIEGHFIDILLDPK